MTPRQVVMTAPELAQEAAALLEAANCRVHYMRPFPSAAEVAEAVRRVAADAVICRQGRITGAVMDASPRLRIVAPPDAVICRQGRTPGAVMDPPPRLRIVARHGVGMDEVDLDAARAR